MKAAGPAVMAQGHRLVIVQLITTRLFCAVVMATESPGSKSRTSKLNDLGAISCSLQYSNVSLICIPEMIGFFGQPKTRLLWREI